LPLSARQKSSFLKLAGSPTFTGTRLAEAPTVRSRFASIGDVYFGFALTSSSHNIIALRGTQSDFEWLLDTAMPQAPVPLA
jgi:triacylglycerol lipase